MTFEALTGTAAALRLAGEQLAEAGATVAQHDPGPSAFGAEGAGELGQVGRALYQQWRQALENRAREASLHGERFDQVAEAVSRAAGGYADIDHAARRRHPEVS
jgi:hypothetical protein